MEEPDHPNDLDLDVYKVEPSDSKQTTSRMTNNENTGNYDFSNAMKYWYRGYKPMDLNFDLVTERKNEDNFYDWTQHDEDDSSVFDF